MANAPTLLGLRVISTRPQHQAESLMHRLASLGAEVAAVPALEIAVLSEAVLTEARKQATNADVVIFISRNAVDAFFSGAPIRLSKMQVCAVGEATALALAERNVLVDTGPSAWAGLPHSTEALLAARNLAGPFIAGRNVVIVRGVGGRPTLGDALRERGAAVVYAEVYERRRPCLDSCPGLRSTLSTLVHTPPPTVLVTSVEGFENFCAMCSEVSPGKATTGWLGSCDYVALSERIAGHIAERWPDAAVCAAPQASDDGVIAALLARAGEPQ